MVFCRTRFESRTIKQTFWGTF